MSRRTRSSSACDERSRDATGGLTFREREELSRIGEGLGSTRVARMKKAAQLLEAPCRRQ